MKADDAFRHQLDAELGPTPPAPADRLEWVARAAEPPSRPAGHRRPVRAYLAASVAVLSVSLVGTVLAEARGGSHDGADPARVAVSPSSSPPSSSPVPSGLVPTGPTGAAARTDPGVGPSAEPVDTRPGPGAPAGPQPPAGPGTGPVHDTPPPAHRPVPTDQPADPAPTVPPPDPPRPDPTPSEPAPSEPIPTPPPDPTAQPPASPPSDSGPS